MEITGEYWRERTLRIIAGKTMLQHFGLARYLLT